MINLKDENVLYIIQTEVHEYNFKSHLNKNGVYYYIDEYCGCEIAEKDNAGTNVYLSSIERGFYNLRGVARLIESIKLWRERPYSTLPIPDKIVIGCDGAIQKQIIQHFKMKNNDIVVELYADGLLEKHSPSFLTKCIQLVEPMLSLLKLDFYLPSVSGTSSLIDNGVVMSESCKKSLIYNGFRGKRLSTAKFPRVSDLEKIERTNFEFRVLLVVSAFAWHSRDDIENWEVDLVKKFTKLARNNLPDINMSIRIHPRSGESLRLAVESSNISSSYLDCNEDIVNSDVVISYASTCLYDASVIGRNVFTITNGAPYIARGEFVESLPEITCIEDLVSVIRSQ